MTKRNLEASIDIDDVATPDWAPRRLRPEAVTRMEPTVPADAAVGQAA